jgi:hypothetical protein
MSVSHGEALVRVAEAWLSQGVRETEGSNKGPDVSWIIHDGGGRPKSAPPWCAYFVSSCIRMVARVLGPASYMPRTGRAVSVYQHAPAHLQILPEDVWTEDAAGLLFVRTRLSKPVTDAEKARRGISRQGHTGVVVSIDAEAREVHCISGNSSGSGHSRVPGGGSVARETIREGDAAWVRLVGFARVGGPEEES